MFDSPEAAEDAYYDALEAADIGSLGSVWNNSDDSYCLLPMMPLLKGQQNILKAFAHMLSQSGGLDISIEHTEWIHQESLAIHIGLEQTPQGAEHNQPPLIAVNTYIKTNQGWQLLGHQNSPSAAPA